MPRRGCLGMVLCPDPISLCIVKAQRGLQTSSPNNMMFSPANFLCPLHGPSMIIRGFKKVDEEKLKTTGNNYLEHVSFVSCSRQQLRSKQGKCVLTAQGVK